MGSRIIKIIYILIIIIKRIIYLKYNDIIQKVNFLHGFGASLISILNLQGKIAHQDFISNF